MTEKDKATHAAGPPPPPTPPKPAEDDDAPKKFKRPLPKAGDKDYVAGQPSSEEEADAIEKAEAERHAALKAAQAKAQAQAQALAGEIKEKK